MNYLKWLVLWRIKPPITAVKMKRHSRSVIPCTGRTSNASGTWCLKAQETTPRNEAGQDPAGMAVLGNSMGIFLPVVFGEQRNLCISQRDQTGCKGTFNSFLTGSLPCLPLLGILWSCDSFHPHNSVQGDAE